MTTIFYAFLIYTLGAVTGAALVIVPAAVAYLRSSTLLPPPARRPPGWPRKTPAPQTPEPPGIDPQTGAPAPTDARRLLDAQLIANSKLRNKLEQLWACQKVFLSPMLKFPDNCVPGLKDAAQLIAYSEEIDKRKAQLTRALEFFSQNCCLYRARGQCLVGCPSTLLCNFTGLKPVQPETIP